MKSADGQLLSTAGLVLMSPMLRTREVRAAQAVTVEIENGRLQGLRENDAVSFRGIPYGADTGGRNRFMAPRPVANWAGVREAPEGYFETGRFEIPDKGLPSWSHPVISDGRLYVRNQDILKVYDIKAPATP